MSSRVRGMEDNGETFQFDDAVNYLLNDASAKKMHGNARLLLILDVVERFARERGLTAEEIVLVVDIITRRNLSVSTTNRLIKTLLPCCLVPVTSVLRCVSWLCTMKPTVSAQGLLIRWIVLIYDLIDDKDTFHAVYAVFFHFLQYEAMCPHVCHLLYLMTRKHDVKVFRVRALLKLQERMGVQPYILGLLALYKIYCPHLVTLSIPKRRKVFFHRTDASWQVALQKIQRSQTESSYSNTAIGSPGSHSRMAAKPKRRRHELIPAVDIVMTSDTTMTRPGLLSQQLNALVPFSQIRSFTHLLSSLDRLELPSQMAAVLTDRNLQHVLRCHPDTAICTRLVYWLDHALTHELLTDADGETERGEQLLLMLIAVSDFLKEGLPVCELFLERFLHMWNGRDYRVYILKLITRCRLRSFAALNELLLEPLRKLMFCSSVFVKCQILICFTDLLRNFVSTELPRCQSTEIAQAEGVDDSDHFSVFSDRETCSEETFHPLDTIVSFIEFVDNVSVVALRQEREHALLHHCVLSFYEFVATMHQAYDVPVAPVLSHELFYKCLFCDHANILMRLCDVMCSYRNAYQAIRHLKTSSSSGDHLIDHIKTFNLYIVDMCDTLWRSRAFSGSDKHPKSVFYLLDPIPPRRQLSAKHSFSLSQHPAMLGLAVRFLAEICPDTTQVQPKLIRQNIDAYLEFLDVKDMPGMKNFVKLFIQRHSTSQSRLSSTTGHS